MDVPRNDHLEKIVNQLDYQTILENHNVFDQNDIPSECAFSLLKLFKDIKDNHITSTKNNEKSFLLVRRGSFDLHNHTSFIDTL